MATFVCCLDHVGFALVIVDRVVKGLPVRTVILLIVERWLTFLQRLDLKRFLAYTHRSFLPLELGPGNGDRLPFLVHSVMPRSFLGEELRLVPAHGHAVEMDLLVVINVVMQLKVATNQIFIFLKEVISLTKYLRKLVLFRFWAQP